jgi:hypothetical protein
LVAQAESIIVKQSIFDDPDDKKIVNAVVDFVNTLRERGAYSNSELPANAVRAYYVDYYLAQVMNGGHSQFIHNSRLQEGELQSIREGLAALNLVSFIDIFKDFEEQVMRDMARAREHGVESEKAFDDRFFKLDAYKTLMPKNGKWLKNLPEVKAVPDLDYEPTMTALAMANPERAGRLADRARATVKYRLSRPLFAAIYLACHRLKLRRPSLGAGISEVNPDGKRQRGWSISYEGGRGLLFLDAKEAIYTEAYLDDGRRFTDEIARQRRDALFANPRDIDRLMKQPKVIYREALRIPMSEIEEAIEAAAAVPIIEAAELAMSQLTAGQAWLENLFPLGRHSPEVPWSWRAESRTTAFTIFFNRDTIFVHDDPAKPALLAFTRAELDSHIGGRPLAIKSDTPNRPQAAVQPAQTAGAFVRFVRRLFG